VFVMFVCAVLSVYCIGAIIVNQSLTHLVVVWAAGWDLTSKRFTEPAVWALDADEAGPDGLGARPPPNTDGTPNEVLTDAAVRLRQLLSILESQSQGETYLLVFPDGTGPALLSAMMAGIPYNRVHELEFAPGEVRLNVTLPSVRTLWRAHQEQQESAYQAILAQGRENLAQLRAGKEVVNLKDARIEREFLEVEQEYREKERQRRQREEAEEATRNAMRKQSAVERGGSEVAASPPPNLWMGSALAGLAAVAVGAGSAALARQEEEDESLTARAIRGGSTNTTLFDVPITTQPSRIAAGVAPSNRTATGTSSADGGGLYSTISNTEGTMTRQRVDGARNNTLLAPPPPSQLDPKEAARQAMEEYMERDDGAGDWLVSLTEILQDDVVVDEDDVSNNNTQNNRNDDLVTMQSKESQEEVVANSNDNTLNSKKKNNSADDGAFQ